MKRAGSGGVTARAVALGLLLTPVNALWVLRMEEVAFGPFPSLIALNANVLSVLFVLVAVNGLVARLRPRRALSQGELLTVFVLLGISTAFAGQSGINVAAGMIGHGAWFGPANGWEFLDTFPDWLVVRDREILKGHYQGHDSFYRPDVLAAWLPRIGAWSLLFFLLAWTGYCVTILVHRQWADGERLPFPVIELPLALTDSGTGATLLRLRLFWAGFIVAGGITLWNGLAFLYPALPSVPVGIVPLNPYLTVRPWDGLDWTPVTLYPLAIGICFLLPLDLLFSGWFFYAFWKSQLVISRLYALDTTPDFPFVKEQGYGAVIALFVYYLWTGRRTYAALGKLPGERGALLGVAAGLAGLLAFGIAAHASPLLVVAFFVPFVAMLVVVARIRAEFGSPVHDFSFIGPDSMLLRLTGTAPLKPTDLAFLGLAYPLTYARTNDPMPVALEGAEAARRRGMDSRRLFGAIVATSVVAILSAFWAYEHQAYALGTAAQWEAGTHFGQEGYTRVAAWSESVVARSPNGPAVGAMGVGLLTTLALLVLRLRIPGFPLHPIAYVVGCAWAINLVWLPMLIVWIIKGALLRYGGLRLYRMAVPLFLGLILGDCVVGSFWGVLGLAMGEKMYNFFGA